MRRNVLAEIGDRRTRDRRPLGERVADLIAEEFIQSDRVAANELLPPEKELSEYYDVSRATIREAVLLLQHAHLIQIRHGVGSVVLPRPRTITHGLDRLCSLETFAREAGKQVETTEVEWDTAVASATVAERLQIAEGAPLTVFRRVKLYDGARMGYLMDYVPEEVISEKELRSLFSSFGPSSLDMFQSHPRLHVDYADVEMSAVNLDEELAGRLHVAPGTAAMSMDAVLIAGGRALGMGYAWYLPEHLRFSIRRQDKLGFRRARSF